MNHQKRMRLGSVDALRGIAAFLVLIIHVSESYLQAPELHATGHALLSLFEWLDIGRIGITIFFLISGFVICKSFHTKKRALKTFAIKRFYRLYPLFWFSILLAVIFIWLPNQRLTLPLLLANITMLPAFFNQEFMIGLYWSLETELIFYIIVAGLYYYGVLKNPLVIIGITCLLYMLLSVFILLPQCAPSLPHWTSTPYHLSLMFLGILMRYRYDQEDIAINIMGLHLSIRFWVGLLLSLLCLIPMVVLIGFSQGLFDHLVSDSIAYLLGIFIFLAGLYMLKKAPSWMIYLGTISYSIYLLHPIVFITLQKLLIKYDMLIGLPIGVYILICAMLTIVLSHLTYQMIEKRWNKKGHDMAKSISHP